MFVKNKKAVSKSLHIFSKEKKGLSEIVAYVILIAITFSIAGIVFAWLRAEVTPAPEIKCDDGISLSIRQIVYNCTSRELNLTLQNRGLFDVDGYRVRVSNISNAKIGVYILNGTGKSLGAGENYNDYYLKSNKTDPSATTIPYVKGTLTLVEIQPLTFQGNQTIYCSDIAKHELSC